MSLKSRACIACYGIGTLFTALSARLIYLAVNKHDQYADMAHRSYISSKPEPIPAWRGTIQDADGSYLARNEPLKDIILDGKVICESKGNKKPAVIAGILAASLDLDPEDVVKRIHPKQTYVVLKKSVTEEVASELDRQLKAAKIKGVIFEQKFKRVYPAHEMLSHVVGFYGYENAQPGEKNGRFHGIEGVERSLDEWLTEQDGWRSFEKDGRGMELTNFAGEERAPRNGANVRLTVSLNMQQIVESELDAACKRLRPLKATVIMMKPETGEILALANRPTFDPNEAGKAKPEERFNNAIAGTLEPGSTFKAVTCAGALDFRLITLKTELFCENGKWSYGGLPLHDHHPYGMLSVSQIIEKSSNIGAAKIALQIGQKRFHDWIRNFGFGQKTGIALTGEVGGILRAPEKWQPVSITRIAMGHEVAVTPLQLITAMSAIANGGTLMMPQIIHDIRDDSGEILRSYPPQVARRVITEDTSGKVRDALIKVTGKQGTAKLAHIPGFNVAGKTGTAQKYENGHPSHDHHVTSFVGFVPAEKPAFCLLVIFDEAKVSSHEDVGGLVAAPVFRAIAERALSHLGIAPDPVLLQQEKEQKIILAKAGRN